MKWTKAALALVCCALVSPLHAAQSYPERPIRLIISASPGTGADYFGRTIAQGLTEMYKQQVIADNRTGAGGLIAMQTLANANPDGYTLGTASSSMMVLPLM